MKEKIILSDKDRYITSCCKSEDWLRSIKDQCFLCIKCRKVCNLKRIQYWKEEFETEAIMGTHFDLTNKKNLEYLAGKYKLVGKVKIKVKKGKIVIEVIK